MDCTILDLEVDGEIRLKRTAMHPRPPYYGLEANGLKCFVLAMCFPNAYDGLREIILNGVGFRYYWHSSYRHLHTLVIRHLQVVHEE